MSELPYPSKPDSTKSRRASAAVGLTDARAIPARWFPADREKLIYLSVAARALPRLLEQLARLPEGSQFDDRGDLWHAIGPSPSRTPLTAAGANTPPDRT